MKRIKQRLLSLAMTGALLLGFTLPETFAASAKSSSENTASETQETASKKTGKNQSKHEATESQAEEKSSKAKNETGKNAKSSEDKEDSSKSETSEKKTTSSNKAVSLTLSISKPAGLSTSGGTWQIDPVKVSALTLSWKCKGDCDSFEVSVSGGIYSASTKKKAVKIPVSGLPEGKYTATVKAIRDGKTVAREKLSFQIIAFPDNEASEEPASESVGDDSAEESATQQAQLEEGMSAESEDAVEAQPDSVDAETDPENRNTREELPAKTAKGESEETKAAEPHEGTEEQNTEEAQDAADAQSDAGNLTQSQDAGIIEEAQDAPGEQPEQDEIIVFEDALVEEVNDAAIEQSTGDECPDLSEPDIQVPQENPIEIHAIAERTLPDVTVAVLDAPEIQLVEADEVLELDEPLDEAVLLVGESESISSNDADEKEKSDNKLTLSIKGTEGVSVIDDAVHVNPAQASAVTLVWSFGGTCDGYAVSISGGVYDKTTKKSQLKLPVKRLSSGQYTVTVTANKDGKALSSACLSFIIDAADREGEATGLAITVASPQGLLITDGIYQIDPAQAEALTLTWQFGGECDAYDVSVSGDVYSGRTEEGTVTISLSELVAGTYTVTVVALKESEAIAQALLSFAIPSQDEKSEDDPGKDGKQSGKPQGGGNSSGGQKGGTARDGEGQEADQSFRVTPGEALINTHTSGTRDMRLYGAVALTLDAENAMNILTLEDTVLDIRLSDGGLFTASLEADALALVPQGEAQTWLLNGYALKTLARSGVTSLRLTLDDMTVEFPTLPELSGSNYGALCTAGRTSRDYCYAVSSNGCSVTVAGQTFQLTAEGELV